VGIYSANLSNVAEVEEQHSTAQEHMEQSKVRADKLRVKNNKFVQRIQARTKTSGSLLTLLGTSKKSQFGPTATIPSRASAPRFAQKIGTNG
jgi:predicted 2-oxoglutarate/Fe(II)-dependent dioxygenase YbiX